MGPTGPAGAAGPAGSTGATGAGIGTVIGDVIAAGNSPVDAIAYNDMLVVGPGVNVVVGPSGDLEIGLSAVIDPAALTTDGGYMSFTLTGANVQGPNDALSVGIAIIAGRIVIGNSFLLRGLNPGLTTVLAKYRRGGAAAVTISNRRLFAIAY